ncbi:MAG TPA: DUF2202 domain-containing protein [Ornithinicoccus sp.]|nr:DUF2202 domain-containing protein [Ornithinicoccus sp.]
MKAHKTVTTALVGATVGAVLAAGAGVAIAQSVADSGTAATAEIEETLLFILEEERMARDLYDALGEAHDGLSPFTQIERSEQQHYDAVAKLVTLKDGTLPEEGSPGVYQADGLQTMYDDWLGRGLTSPEAAFQVGVELETADIANLRSTIEEIDDADVDRVMSHLLRASEHHLQAFEAAAAGDLPELTDMGGHRRGPGGKGPRGQGVRGHGMAEDGGRMGPGAGPGERGHGSGQRGMGRGMGPGTGDCPAVQSED